MGANISGEEDADGGVEEGVLVLIGDDAGVVVVVVVVVVDVADDAADMMLPSLLDRGCFGERL
jgi:hypothetical protein